MTLEVALGRVGELSLLAERLGTIPPSAAPGGAFAHALARAQATGPDRPLPPSSGEGRVPYQAAIEAAARRQGIDPLLVQAVIEIESGFDPQATSPAGAQGLMQLMPATARALGVADPYDPIQSIEGGTRYLADQLRRFGDLALALAAYNAGPGAVAAAGGIPENGETPRYVERALARYAELVAGRGRSG